MITKVFIQSRGEASPPILCMRSLTANLQCFVCCGLRCTRFALPCTKHNKRRGLRALASRGSQAARASACVCARLGHKGHLRHTTHTQTHKHTSLSAQAQFLAPGKWKAPNHVGSLTLVTEELLLLLLNSYFPSRLTCTISPWPPLGYFLLPVFSCFLLFLFPYPRGILCRNTFETQRLYKKKDSGLNFIEQQS